MLEDNLKTLTLILLFYIFDKIILAIVTSWFICYILTISGALPSDPAKYGYLARTDVMGNAVADASWFTFPYPGMFTRRRNTLF